MSIEDHKFSDSDIEKAEYISEDNEIVLDVLGHYDRVSTICLNADDVAALSKHFGDGWIDASEEPKRSGFYLAKWQDVGSFSPPFIVAYSVDDGFTPNVDNQTTMDDILHKITHWAHLGI